MATINEETMKIIEDIPSLPGIVNEFELNLADLTNDIDEDDLMIQNESNQQVNFKPIADTINQSGNSTIIYTPFNDHDADCPCESCWPEGNASMIKDMLNEAEISIAPFISDVTIIPPTPLIIPKLRRHPSTITKDNKSPKHQPSTSSSNDKLKTKSRSRRRSTSPKRKDNLKRKSSPIRLSEINISNPNALKKDAREILKRYEHKKQTIDFRKVTTSSSKKYDPSLTKHDKYDPEKPAMERSRTARMSSDKRRSDKTRTRKIEADIVKSIRNTLHVAEIDFNHGKEEKTTQHHILKMTDRRKKRHAKRLQKRRERRQSDAKDREMLQEMRTLGYPLEAQYDAWKIKNNTAIGDIYKILGDGTSTSKLFYSTSTSKTTKEFHKSKDQHQHDSLCSCKKCDDPYGFNGNYDEISD